MSHSTLFSTLSMRLCVLAAGLVFIGCEPESNSGGGARSGSNQGDGQGEVGGGFSPDPDCAYDCVEVGGTETVCLQTCDDGCQTLVMRQEVVTGESTDVTETAGGHCPGQFPAPGLWELTCEIFYGATESDCDETYSEQACEVALDLCLPAD